MKIKLIGLVLLLTLLKAFGQNNQSLPQTSREIDDTKNLSAILSETEYSEYKSWVSIGPGGLPHTLEGYRSLQKFNKQLRNPFDLSYIFSNVSRVGDVHTLVSLAKRAGNRPTIAPFAIPHRQLNQHNSPEMREKQKALLQEILNSNTSKVIIKKSYFEKHNDAFFVADTNACNQALLLNSRGEIGHLHPSDGSMHFILSPSDTKEVIEKAWGELHGLAGQAINEKDTLAYTLTMIYSPQTDGDLQVLKRIAEAAIKFANYQTK